MQPDERLDALLSQRQSGAGSLAPRGEELAEPERAYVQPAGEGEMSGLDALLDAADRFAVWGSAEPSAAFADQLEAGLLARFAADPQAPVPAMRSDASASDGVIAAPVQLSTHRPRHRRSSPAHASRLLWRSAAAAAVLLVLGASILAAAAASAAPGQPLYGLHRFEQGIRADLSGNQADRVRLHLQYAQDALGAFDAAVTQRSGDAAYDAALSTFTEEERSASEALAGLPSGEERDALAAQLAALHEHGRHDLRAALPALDWSARVITTTALAQIGDSVPQIAQTSVTGVRADGNYTWTVTIRGAGFAPGAVLLVDGRPLGTIISLSPTTLVAQLSGNQLPNGSHTFGVGNPDGTAAVVTQITSAAGQDGQDDHGKHGTPGTQSTPGSDDHHGGTDGGGDGSGGSSGGSGSGSGSGSGGDHGGDGSGSATPTP